MFETLHRATEIPAAELNSLPGEIIAGGQPAVLHGAFRNWPLRIAKLRQALPEFLG